MHELHSAFQVASQEYQRGTGGTEGDAGPETAPGQPDEVVDQSEGAGGNQGRDQRNAQVVSNAGCNAGQLGQEGHHEMAEVVVADGIAREPRVFWREEPALEHRVHEPEVHWLLGVIDGGRLRNDAQPHQEEANE